MFSSLFAHAKGRPRRTPSKNAPASEVRRTSFAYDLALHARVRLGRKEERQRKRQREREKLLPSQAPSKAKRE